MNYLSVENISRRFGHKLLFENISFGIAKGEKVALIAKNGTGKTTLLNAITGKDPADSGQVVFRNDIRPGYLPQEPDLREDASVINAILEKPTPITQAIEAYEAALENPHDQEALQRAINDMDQHQAWNFEADIKQVLGKLKIDDWKAKISSLSGGQKKRVALAKVLLEEPDLLILDEPTNHLDLDMIEWLENFLARSNFSLLMVTHDRYFLENVCTDILELSNGELYRYKGSYSYFLEKKAEREEIERSGIEKAKNLMRTELEWMRRMPKARGTKAKYRVEAFGELQQKAGKRSGEDILSLEVKASRMGTKILELHKVSKAYGDKQLISQIDYTFKRREKAGITGPNGSGKSTLVKMILGEVQPDKGKIVAGETIKFGYYAQTGILPADNKRVIEVVKDIAEVIPAAGGRKITAAQLLERFLFPRDMHYNLVETLSGGEKRRLYLLTVLMENPNFLIFDEPTNDLDLQSLNVLEDYLADFEGCVLVISHDRFFMDKIVDHLFVFEGNGEIRDFPGNYTQYREEIKKEASQQKASPKQTTAQVEAPAKSPAGKTKLTYAEKLEYEKLEKEIARLEEKKETLSRQMSSGVENVELLRLSEEMQATIDQIDAHTERWMELAEYAEN